MGMHSLIGGLVLMTGGLAYLPLVLGDGAGWLELLPGLVVFGIGMGVVFAPPGTLAMAAIAPELAGAASGALTTIRMLGTTIGSAAVGALLQARLAAVLTGADLDTASRLRPIADPKIHQGLTSAISTTYLLPTAALAVLTAACVVAAVRNTRSD